MIDTKELRKVIADCYWPTSPVAINEILDRLEAAEKGRNWHAERCEDAMNKCDALRAEIEELHVLIAAVKKQADAEFCLRVKKEEEYTRLRAKVADMEKQEPVAWTTKLALRHGANALGFDACADNLWGEKGVPLYTLPGAHPKPDCGEAGHDEGRCGNRQCLPGAQPAPSIKDAIIDDLQSQFDSEGITEHDSGDALIRLSDAIAAVEDNFVQSAPSVPDAWKLVPIEPTQEMINRVIDERLDALAAGKDHTFIDIYKTMLAAAPKPEAKP